MACKGHVAKTDGVDTLGWHHLKNQRALPPVVVAREVVSTGMRCKGNAVVPRTQGEGWKIKKQVFDFADGHRFKCLKHMVGVSAKDIIAKSVFDQKTLSNPVTDVIDSYYILKAMIQSRN